MKVWCRPDAIDRALALPKGKGYYSIGDTVIKEMIRIWFHKYKSCRMRHCEKFGFSFRNSEKQRSCAALGGSERRGSQQRESDRPTMAFATGWQELFA